MSSSKRIYAYAIIALLALSSYGLFYYNHRSNSQLEAKKSIVESSGEPIVGAGAALVGPNFFKISSQSVTLNPSTRDFYIGGGTASSSLNVVFAVDPIADIVSVFSTASFDFYGEIRPDGATCSNGQTLVKTGANNWDCGDSAGGGGGGGAMELRENSAFNTNFRDGSVASISFNDGAFDLTASSGADVIVKLDYTNGPASRSSAQTWTALNTFDSGVSVSTNFEITGNNRLGINAGGETNTSLEVGGGASISGIFTSGGTGSNSFAGSLSISKGLTALGFSGSGLSNCVGAGQFLRYSLGGGLFSCGTIIDADIPDTITASNYQTLDSTLTALAAYNTNGILTQTAADTFTGRTIIGTSNQITLTNGDGVAGNPTISIPSLFSITNASISTNFEVSGTASISSFKLIDSATGVAMVDCDATTKALGWDITTGRFFCGTDDDSGGGAMLASGKMMGSRKGLFFGGITLQEKPDGRILIIDTTMPHVIPKAVGILDAAKQSALAASRGLNAVIVVDFFAAQRAAAELGLDLIGAEKIGVTSKHYSGSCYIFETIRPH